MAHLDPNIRIVIADDSDVMLKQLRTILDSHAGWTVCGEATNGRQAVLRAHELKPDLIILDLAMPMLDGFSAAAEILKLLPSVPIVIFTLHVLPHMELEAKKFGIRAVISKSADRKILIGTLEGLLIPNASIQLGHSTEDTVVAPLCFSEAIETPSESNPDASAEPPIVAD